MSSKRLAKRFYKDVSISGEGGNWHILLDGMQLRTPGKLKLSVPSQGLAQKIASEWEAQDEYINPSSMPVTRLANVAVEQTPQRRGDLVDEVLRYAETDLLCYRSPQPRVLKERQAKAWDEWVNWASEQNIHLETTESLNAIKQPAASLKNIEAYAVSLEDIELTLFVHLIAVFGSVILAKAVMERALTPVSAFDLSRLEAIYQIELWGEDEEQAEITAALRAETMTLGGVLGDL